MISKLRYPQDPDIPLYLSSAFAQQNLVTVSDGVGAEKVSITLFHETPFFWGA